VTLAPGTAGSEVVVRSFIKFDFCGAAAGPLPAGERNLEHIRAGQ